MKDNPLLQFDTLPDFSIIRAEHVQPAVEQVLSENRAALAGILQREDNRRRPDWQSLMQPLEELEDRLDKVWSAAGHLKSVSGDSAIRDAYDACQPMVTAYESELGQNGELFQAVKALADRGDELSLDGSQRKILSDLLREFHLAGVDLEGSQRERFAELQTRLGELSNRFSNNVLDATMGWTEQVTDPDLLEGLPEHTLETAAAAAERKGLEGWLLTLDFPCFYAVMTMADNRELRERMYRAHVTRASEVDHTGGRWDNSEVMRDILACRQEMAQLLGYANYAEMSLSKKMARSVDEVNAFLDDLLAYARPAAEREFAQLQAFARDEHGLEALEAWDVPYYGERLRQRDYAISQEALRPYFPVDRVLEGLFRIVQTLYGVRIRPVDTRAWHPDVRGFVIEDDSGILARFFLDLHAREGKRGGAWMADYQGRRMRGDGQWQIPVAFLTCNFAPPAGDRPALLTHDEVTTLFHEFGHGLHHMLTREPYLHSAGLNGVAWDAVELPSQLLENWCWDRRVIGMISGHYRSGEALPEAMLDRLLAARNFQSGMKCARQLEFALFDFNLHQRPVEDDPAFIGRVLQQARERASVTPVPEFNRFQHSFGHIFAGGYAAGYYSYKWAEVLSADVFSRFAENGLFDHATGRRFLDRLLARGGGEDALTLFVDFMGREPKLEALLQQDGLANP